jgi:hypothetical protein
MNLRLIGVSIFFPEPGKGSLSLADCPLPPEMGGGGGLHTLTLFTFTAFSSTVQQLLLPKLSWTSSSEACLL